MEVPQERQVNTNTHRVLEAPRSDTDSETGNNDSPELELDTQTLPNTTDDSELELNKQELTDLAGEIDVKEQRLKSRYQQVVERKAAAKEDIQFLFDDLKNILVKKQQNMLNRVDSSFESIEFTLSHCLGTILSTKQIISEVLDKSKCDRTMLKSQNTPVEEMQVLQEDAKSHLEFADQMLEYEAVPEYRVNFNVKGTINNLKFDALESDYEVGNNNEGIGDNNAFSFNEVAVEIDDSRLTNDETAVENNINVPSSRPQSETSVNNEEVEGATGVSGESITPSAPPIPLDEGQEEDSPPPYWQAVGLPGPHEDFPPSQANVLLNYSPVAGFSSAAPTYNEATMSSYNLSTPNKLVLWHSFPIKRHSDSRTAQPVAIAWNYQRICVADKANKKIKFFSASGGLLTTTNCSGGEIYDFGFLEEVDGDVRYIFTIPKMKTLLILSIGGNNQCHLVGRIQLPGQHYSYICKGPREQTLLGADNMSKNGPARVDIFDFSGNILQSFACTPTFEKFSYPKAIEVFQNHIIVADWKLNVVCVYMDDGSPVGQYKGTPTTPLLRPLSLTLDHFGNIFILDGELPNIHIIDLKCSPIEVIRVPKCGSGTSTPKMMAFDLPTKRLVVARSTGDIAIFQFQGGYRAPRQGEMPVPVSYVAPQPRPADVLPLVEGILPSTIENIARPRTSRVHMFDL